MVFALVGQAVSPASSLASLFFTRFHVRDCSTAPRPYRIQDLEIFFARRKDPMPNNSMMSANPTVIPIRTRLSALPSKFL